ncbi:redox-regulated ATPase YchF [archaeon]|jgi:ribosome-binding ATPase|nr:redox-regulated ATPase YchF [archaeon]MBT6762029.1 redox-regulated ATPase YchF [archaeon]
MLLGIVGKPNVGKSTFFKAITLADVEIANYPFATIKPNSGVAYVKIKDVAQELGKAANPREGYVQGPFRFVPIQVIDVAGLVPGASEGKGMGNQFLDDLRQADALIHVIDISGSTNEKGESVEPGSYDPKEDIKFLAEELDLWYLGILDKGWSRFARQVQQEKAKIEVALAKQLSGLKVNEEHIEQAIKNTGIDAEKPQDWTPEQLRMLATDLRKQTKPMIIAANKFDTVSGRENYTKIKAEFPNIPLIPVSAESELALREASKASLIDYIPQEKSFNILKAEKLTDRQLAALQFIKEKVMGESDFGTGVQEVLNLAIFSLLKMIAVHPGGASKLEDKDGNTLPDCFLMKDGTTALEFAYKLHTDLGKNFIRAIDVKSKKTVGKDHLLKHLDIIEIVAGR